MTTRLGVAITSSGIAAVLAAPFALGTAIQANESRTFAVAVRLRVDPSIASRRITAGLKEETETIWRPYDIRLDWADAETSDPAPGVVSLDATIERESTKPQRLTRPSVLGRVVVNPGPADWRPIYVSVDAIERVLADRPITRRVSIAGIVRNLDLRRALGRVLAHEIGHVLIGVSDHDQAGLMRAAFSADELGDFDSGPFRLMCGTADRVRSRLSALAGYMSPDLEEDGDSLDVEGPPTTIHAVRATGASCIATQSAQ